MQEREIGELMHNIELLSIDINKIRQELEVYKRENERLFSDNERTSREIPDLKERISNVKQKIQLNEMLKEVDLDEIKMLRQNNMSVNSAISSLITRWETLESK